MKNAKKAEIKKLQKRHYENNLPKNAIKRENVEKCSKKTAKKALK